jgi:hypothetical protein
LCARALLPVYCSVQGRISNEKTQGVLNASSGQDTKADHENTIGSQEPSDPDSLCSGPEGW